MRGGTDARSPLRALLDRVGSASPVQAVESTSTLQVSITDAVGHDVAAAVLATVLVGGLRDDATVVCRTGTAARRGRG